MKLEIVICKSAHDTKERGKLLKELKNADFFVPEFFQPILNINYEKNDEVGLIPAKRVKESYESAKKTNKNLKVIEIEESDYFYNMFPELDEKESAIRKLLLEDAFIRPLSRDENEIEKSYKRDIDEINERINDYVKINEHLEDKFSELLAKEIKKLKGESLKIVIDSGYLHLYKNLKKDIEKATGSKVVVREEEENIKKGFVEDIFLKERNGMKVDENDFARAILFEAVYSPVRNSIQNDFSGIDRDKQDEIYKKYVPKIAHLGKKELKQFWKSIRDNAGLMPYMREEDMKKVLDDADLHL